MRLILSIALSALGFAYLSGCSSDDTSSTTAPSTTAGTGGVGTGGSSGSSTGGASTGGRDPKDCPADSGAESCRECLASNCCDAYAHCLRDHACATALEAYRTCANAAVSGSDKGRCFATFSQSMKDAGASAAFGQAIGICVYKSCISCGASSI